MPSSKICPECEREFIPQVDRQVRCSKSCAAKAFNATRRKQERLCEFCGASYRYRKLTQRTCSKSCAQKLAKTAAPGEVRVGTIAQLGYQLLRVDGKAILEHRYVMEQHLGRPLKSSELVHHRDGNKLNNDLSNLELTDRSAHPKQHCEMFRSETHKQCRLCLQVKPRAEFGPRKLPGRDPNRTRCRACGG